MPLGGLLIAGAGTLISGAEGISQNAKANAIQKNLKDPVYNIPPEFYQNREIARQMAQQGIPQEQYNNATNNINQTQAAGLAAISKSANPGSGVTSVVRQGNAATANLNAEDAQARQNNQRYFVQENSQLAGQELAKQQSDVFDKYTRDFNQMQAYRGAGLQNINTAAQGLSQLGLTDIKAQGDNPSATSPQGTLPPGTAAKMQLPPFMWAGQGQPETYNYSPYVNNY